MKRSRRTAAAATLSAAAGGRDNCVSSARRACISHACDVPTLNAVQLRRRGCRGSTRGKRARAQLDVLNLQRHKLARALQVRLQHLHELRRRARQRLRFQQTCSECVAMRFDDAMLPPRVARARRRSLARPWRTAYTSACGGVRRRLMAARMWRASSRVVAGVAGADLSSILSELYLRKRAGKPCCILSLASHRGARAVASTPARTVRCERRAARTVCSTGRTPPPAPPLGGARTSWLPRCGRVCAAQPQRAKKRRNGCAPERTSALFAHSVRKRLRSRARQLRHARGCTRRARPGRAVRQAQASVWQPQVRVRC
jgi:hypothetical protein